MTRAKQVVDRRIQKTRQALSQALIDLILKQGYERVTVQEILDRANVGRSTFYAHYESKDQLLMSGPRNLGHTLFGEPVTGNPAGHRQHPMAFSGMFQHVSNGRRLARAMLGKKAGALMLQSFQQQVAVTIREHYRNQKASRKNPTAFRYLVQATAAAVVSLLSSWVDEDFSLPVEEISSRCQRLVEGVFQ